MSKSSLGLVAGVVVFVILPLSYYFYDMFTPGKLDSFAQCLQDKGVLFYGAFWCPHCQAQKAVFGKSAKLLPYTECSTPDAQGQVALCKEKEIKAYPTWVFPDGDRQVREMTLKELSDKTSCPLPD